jgi:cyclophilin family peptidyl-prolyl cis-trans isomerase
MRRLILGAGIALALAGCGASDATIAPTTQPRPTSPPAALATEQAPTTAPADSGARPTSDPASAAGQPKKYTAEPAMAIDASKQYIATIKTEKGDIVIELNAKNAPRTVNNFVFLAREGFYDGVTFHRVIPGCMAQGGDPTGTGMGGPGYEFPNEYDPALKLAYDKPGVVAMANAGPDTNGSQFFITFAPTSLSAADYTIFGQVVEGQDVVEQITPRDPGAGGPPGDKILTVTIEEK